jgi:membrane complex biogenesis BtpA family protein
MTGAGVTRMMSGRERMSQKDGALSDLFGDRRPIIGVVHLLPLPGSPRYGGSLAEVTDRACADAQGYIAGGLDGLILENYGDLPFFPGPVPPETVAAMTVVAKEIGQMTERPLGINVLRNDALSALGIAAAVGASFIRVNVLMGASVTDQGLVQGQAHRLLRRRRELGSEVKIFADVLVKHAHPLGRMDVAQSARELLERGLADVLIVTGAITGQEPSREDLERVKAAAGESPVLAGSGVRPENISNILTVADGAIVGTSLKKDGRTERAVDIERVRALLANLGR